ncbi:hypothetical protein HDV02_001690 [Globomyces sp. JEL0801]|nr:hypothetical protein HDV02_001690 [Globomyces sp. JEL0801]
MGTDIQTSNDTVDYFSYDFNTFDLHATWSHATKNKNTPDNDLVRRYENACWRKFFQQRFNLKRIDPTTLNWNKDSCWLYGPYHKAILNHDKSIEVEVSQIEKKKKGKLLLKRKSDPAGMLNNLNKKPQETLDPPSFNPSVCTGGISF